MVKQSLLKSIGKEIAKKRLTIRMTQEALDRSAGLPIGSVRKYETGKINITLENLDRMCVALGCRLDITIRKVSVAKEVIEEESKFMY